MRPAWVWSALLIAMMVLSACAAPKTQSRCLPEVGMTTEDLVDCGCRLLDSGALRSAGVVRAESEPWVQTIIVVNYICPLGRDGLATVSVVNGVAGRVYY